MSNTSDSPYGYPPAGFPVAAEPAPARTATFLAACGALLGSVLVGLLGGLVWGAIAPKTVYVVVSHGSADVVNPETTAFIAGDVWFVVIALIGGLIIGLVSYRLAIRRFGPAPMAAVLAGSVGAGYAARWVGQNLGLSKFNSELLTSRQGTLLHAPPVLGGNPATVLWSAIVFWPLAACLVPAGLVALSAVRDRPPSGRRASLR